MSLIVYHSVSQCISAISVSWWYGYVNTALVLGVLYLFVPVTIQMTLLTTIYHLSLERYKPD